MAAFRESAEYSVPPEVLFDLVTDQDRVADWNEHVQHVEVVGGGSVEVGSRLRQHRRRGSREFDLEFEVVAHESPIRHAVTGSVFGTTTTVTFLIEPSSTGSRMTMLAEVAGRGLGTLLAPIVAREMRKSTVAALAALADIAGGGAGGESASS